MTEPEILQKLGAARILVTLKRYRGIRETAEKLGVSHTGLRRFFSQNSIEYHHLLGIPAGQKRRYRLTKTKSSIVRWVKAHPGIPLPRDMKGIARITGVTIWAAQKYLFRAKKKYRDAMLDFVMNAGKYPVYLRDNQGRATHTGGWRNVCYAYDRCTFITVLKFTSLDDVEHTCEVKDYKELVKAIEIAKLGGYINA